MTNQRRLRRRYRTLVQASYDCLCWFVALVLASWIIYDFDYRRLDLERALDLLPIVVVADVAAGVLFGMYRGRWRLGSFDEVLALVKGVGLATVVLFLANLLFEPYVVPRSAALSAGLAALALMGGGRYIWRWAYERGRRPVGSDCERLIVFGAGEGGVQIVQAMLSNPRSHYLPVALLDDDPRKRNLRISGVRVVGTREGLADAVAATDADALLIAIPSADAELIAGLSVLAFEAGVPVKVLPPVDRLLDGNVSVGDIRDIAPEDLLGRPKICTDLDLIAGYVTGKRVLVTGAGGSIGSELCRQIYNFGPAELIKLDRDESALHAVELSIHGRALLDSPDIVLADLRDRPAIHAIMAARRPQVIFHAAALKHLPILERHPAEAVKTNVWATLDLLEVAVAHGVERFVNISTDKAADPCSVLGYSKRITERLTSYLSRESSTVCLSVRFGNVLGSRGSVLTAFQAQVERGGPITVTHPDVTRYFMTVGEAVELVIQAGAIGSDGEVLVLDMGEPVRIAEVAQVLAARSERPVTIQYTGLRGGEKLHEVLLGADETDTRPEHPLISHVGVCPLEPAVARSINIDAPHQTLVGEMADLCSASTQLLRLNPALDGISNG